jgi:hypothetical protein
MKILIVFNFLNKQRVARVLLVINYLYVLKIQDLVEKNLVHLDQFMHLKDIKLHKHHLLKNSRQQKVDFQKVLLDKKCLNISTKVVVSNLYLQIKLRIQEILKCLFLTIKET